MDGSQNCHHLSLKSHIRAPSSKSTHSGNGENEYESDGERGISRSRKTQPATNKNFMSPTFSAASKAVKTPRKNILTERNEDSSLYAPEFSSSFSGTHLQKAPILDPKSSIEQIRNPTSNVISPPSVHSDNNDEDPFRTNDSSTLPSYDPIKNYLSPRPKFLRYRPNRRRETILGRELDGKDEGLLLSLNASTVTSDSKKSSDEEEEEAGDGSLEQKSQLTHEAGQSEILEETDDEEEIDEELEEDNSWSLKWVSKTLLVFLVLLLCTAYISSMNSPPPRLPLQLKRSPTNESQAAEVRILNKITMWHFGGANDIYEPWEETWEAGIYETELPDYDGVMDEDPDQVLQVLEGVEKGGENESSYDHRVEEPGDWSNLSHVSLFTVLDPREPPLLPLTDPMYDLSSASSWYSSYSPAEEEEEEEEEAPASSVIFDQGTIHVSPSSVDEKSPVEDANRITEGIVLRKKAIDQAGIMGSTIVDHNATANAKAEEPAAAAAAAPAKPELVKIGSDSEAKVTYDYMYGSASDGLTYVSICSFAALAFVVVKLFLKSRRLRNSSSIATTSSKGGGGSRGGIPRRGSSRNGATIEQAEEALPITDPVAPIPTLRDGSPSVELLSEFNVGGVNKRSSVIKREMADSEPESGPSRVQQEPTMMMDIHSYGSFVGQELIGQKTVSSNMNDGGKDEARTTTPVSVRRSTRIRNRGAKSP